MRIKDKPATPVPSRLLGLVLLVAGGLFIGDFVWTVATYSPSILSAPLSVWGVVVAGIGAGSVVVGVGVAAVLHSSGRFELPSGLELKP